MSSLGGWFAAISTSCLSDADRHSTSAPKQALIVNCDLIKGTPRGVLQALSPAFWHNVLTLALTAQMEVVSETFFNTAAEQMLL